MPERQSSPGEVTARPTTDGNTNGNGNHPAPPEVAVAAAPGSIDAPTVAAQISGQVAAEPEVVEPEVVDPEVAEPAPAEPGDPSPTGDASVADGAAMTATGSDDGMPAVDPAEPDRRDEAGPTGSAGPPAAPPTEVAQTVQIAKPAERTGGAAPDATAPDRPSAGHVGAGSPTAAAPTEPGPVADVAAPVDPPPPPSSDGGAAQAPPARPRPRPYKAGAASAPTPAPSSGPKDAAAEAATVAVAAVRRPTNAGQGTWFNAWDGEATQMMSCSDPAGDQPQQQPDVHAAETPPVGRTSEDPHVDAAPAPTEQVSVPAAAAQLPPTGTDTGLPPIDTGDAAARSRRRPTGRRVLLTAAAVILVLAGVYGADLAISSGSVPRGVTVAGVSVGGVALDAAEQRLRTEIEPRTSRPVAVTVGEARAEIDPSTAGLAVDWTATLAQAGSQPLNPITRITSFFTEREVGVVTATDRAALDAALAELAPIVDKAPVEGTVRFEGSTPVPVDPVAGQELDLPGAAAVLERSWATGSTVALPLSSLAPITTPDDVAGAVAQVAQPAVAGPVTVVGEGGNQGVLSPEVIAAALSFRADPAGELVPELNQTALAEALTPQLAASEQPSRDAKLDFSSGAAVVVPSQDGRGVDYPATLKDLLAVLTGTGPRQVTAIYADQPAELTTEELKALGISGVIGEFTTGGFAADSGQNIKRAAEQINGTVVQPGQTFSLNAKTNPRDAAHGYVEAGIISDGHPARGIGGGVSQVATTTYNAAYFAGMTDVAHREHSFYISRYPAGREATVFDNAIDLKFRNDNPTAVMIQTVWTPSSLTVRIYGTKRYEVTSATGPRTNPTEPNTVTIPAGEECKASPGAPGFTVTDTRTLREISTGQTRSETRTVRYNPSPIVICEG